MGDNVIKVKVDNYYLILEELKNAEIIMNEAMEELQNTINNIEENLGVGESIDVFSGQVHNMLATNTHTVSQIVFLINLVEDLIELLTNNVLPVNDGVYVYLDIDPMKETLNEFLEIFDKQSGQLLKDTYGNSDTYDTYLNSIHRELDNTIGQGLLNPIDEMKQKDAERIFYHNKDIMNSINEYLMNELTFKRELEATQDLIRKLGDILGIFKEFPIRLDMEDFIYWEFMENRLGISNLKDGKGHEIEGRDDGAFTSDDIYWDKNGNGMNDGVGDPDNPDDDEDYEEKTYVVYINGEPVYYTIGSDHQLRVDTENINSKEDAIAVTNAVCESLEEIYPEYAGMSNEEICQAEYGTTVDNVASEIYGHSLLDSSEAGSQADINGKDNVADDGILENISDIPDKQAPILAGGGDLDDLNKGGDLTQHDTDNNPGTFN